MNRAVGAHDLKRLAVRAEPSRRWESPNPSRIAAGRTPRRAAPAPASSACQGNPSVGTGIVKAGELDVDVRHGCGGEHLVEPATYPPVRPRYSPRLLHEGPERPDAATQRARRSASQHGIRTEADDQAPLRGEREHVVRLVAAKPTVIAITEVVGEARQRCNGHTASASRAALPGAWYVSLQTQSRSATIADGSG